MKLYREHNVSVYPEGNRPPLDRCRLAHRSGPFIKLPESDRRTAPGLAGLRAEPNDFGERGFALIFGLLLLVVMSLAGITMMSTNSLETKMSGGERERGIAFQAAEAALRDAERLIELSVSIDADFPDSSTATTAPVGRIGEDHDDPDYFEMATWVATASQEFTWGDYPEMHVGQPRQIIKHVGLAAGAPPGEDLEIKGYEETFALPDTNIFRVTARATGRDGSAVCILQTHYGKQY